MPYGVKITLATLLRVMEIIFSSVKWQFALVYLDVIVIFSQTPWQHTDHAGLVLSLLKEAEVTLKLRQSAVPMNKIFYLGHVVQSNQTEVSSHTTDAICYLKIPRTQTKRCSIIGYCDFFRRIDPNFARIASLLARRFCTSQANTLRQLNKANMTVLQTFQEKCRTMISTILVLRVFVQMIFELRTRYTTVTIQSGIAVA